MGSIIPGSNWLHRLRASRGFPAETGIDLEHFLAGKSVRCSNVGIAEKAAPDPATSLIPNIESSKLSSFHYKNVSLDPPGLSDGEKEENLVDLMRSVLAELFNMGQGSLTFMRTTGSKNCRKQTNPKICIYSSSSAVSIQDSCLPGDHIQSVSRSCSDNHAGEINDGVKNCHLLVNAEEEVSETPRVGSDLDSLAHVLVTVIDTSSPTWKSEKLLHRKGSVWKIRNRKWIMHSASRKKRKLSQCSNLAGKKEEEKMDHFLPHNENQQMKGLTELVGGYYCKSWSFSLYVLLQFIWGPCSAERTHIAQNMFEEGCKHSINMLYKVIVGLKMINGF